MTALESIYRQEYQHSTEGLGVIVWLAVSVVLFVALTIVAVSGLRF